MRLLVSVPPRSDSAANCSAAAHPSVDVVNASTSPRDSCRPPTSLSKAAASSVSKRSALGIDLDQLVADPQSAQGKPHAGPAGHDDLQVVASVVQQEAERGPGLAVGDAMPVVDHHRDPVVLFVDFVDERCHHVAAGIIAVVFQYLPQRLGERGADPPDRFEQMCQEPHLVVVVVIDRQPGDRDTLTGRVPRATARPACSCRTPRAHG